MSNETNYRLWTIICGRLDIASGINKDKIIGEFLTHVTHSVTAPNHAPDPSERSKTNHLNIKVRPISAVSIIFS